MHGQQNTKISEASYEHKMCVLIFSTTLMCIILVIFIQYVVTNSSSIHSTFIMIN